MLKKNRSTKVPTVKEYTTVRTNRPEIGARIIYSAGYPKRHINAVITGIVELNGAPVQFVVVPENGTFEKHIYLAEVAAYRWDLPAVIAPAAAVNYGVQ